MLQISNRAAKGESRGEVRSRWKVHGRCVRSGQGHLVCSAEESGGLAEEGLLGSRMGPAEIQQHVEVKWHRGGVGIL